MIRLVHHTIHVVACSQFLMRLLSLPDADVGFRSTQNKKYTFRIIKCPIYHLMQRKSYECWNHNFYLYDLCDKKKLSHDSS